MKTTTITNWKYFVDIMGLERAKQVSKLLTQLVNKEQPTNKIILPYKSVEEYGESGYCDFEFKGVVTTKVYDRENSNFSFEFIGTMS